MDHLSTYLENMNFIRWVFQPDEESESWWKNFMIRFPEEKRNIELARKVLQKFRTNRRDLSEEDKILLFSQILKRIEERQKRKVKSRLFTGFLRYAAVAILFFSIGALLFYRKDNRSPQYISQNMVEPVSDESARLILPDGKKIPLEEKQSKVEYRSGGKLVVNDDTVQLVNHGQPNSGELNQVVIPYGKSIQLLLSDGTRVWLNAGSRFAYPQYFGKGSREVLLVGEAFFEVKPGKNNPFIVQTTDLRVKVLGTKFNISAYPSDNIIETVLTEGKVTLEQNNSGFFERPEELLPNQLASYDKTRRETRIITVDTDDYTLWKEGMYKFESTHLSRIVKKLERYYDIHIRFDDPLLGSLSISGKLELHENREEVLGRIASAASIKINFKGDNYYEISE